MNALEKALELSNWAVAWVGPKIRKPCFRNSSTTPAAKGDSGPTTVTEILFASAHTRSSVGSVIGTMNGAKALPDKWIAPLHDTIRSSLKGFDHSSLRSLAQRTISIANFSPSH